MKNAKKPGILFIINCLSLGGAEIFILRLSQFLSSDFNIYILTVFEDKNDSDFLNAFITKTGGIQIKKFAGLSLWEDWLYWKLNAIGRFFCIKNVYSKLALFHEREYYRKTIKKNNIKIMNSHLSAADHFALIKIRSSCKTPWVITMHSSYNPIHFNSLDELKRELIVEKFKSTLLSADHIFCVSEINKEIFKMHNWSPLPEKVYLGINKSNLEPKSTPYFTFCMVGRGIKEKGWELALNSFEKLEKKYKKIRLIIISPENDYITNLKTIYKENKSILFSGYLSEPISLMSTANCGLLPSFGESLPYSVIEFLSLGIPVIVSNRGEMPLMIDSNIGKAGSVIDDDENGNPSELSLLLKMEEILSSSNSNKSEFRARAHLAFEKFSMKQCGGRYKEVFNLLIEKKNNSRYRKSSNYQKELD
jgi:glycosyltransferase involved in cell wall biosynthesis